jgi:hypothetical protein
VPISTAGRSARRGDVCRYLPSQRVDDWHLSDPVGQPTEVVQTVHDELRYWVGVMLAESLPAELS